LLCNAAGGDKNIALLYAGLSIILGTYYILDLALGANV
jgi:hypothetical protein